jgi:flagellar protein FlaG
LLIRPLDAAVSPAASAAGGLAVSADDRGAGAPAGGSAQSASPAPTREAVEAAAKSANASLAAINAAIEFTIDPDTKAVIVRLIDMEDHSVLRQIPSQEMLEIAKAIDQLQGTLLKSQA